MPIPPIFWCSASQNTPAQAESRPAAAAMDEADTSAVTARACASASLRRNTELWKHNVLKVNFLRKSKNNVKKSTLLAKWDMEEETILEWANRWSSEAEEFSNIPVFELCKREREADIVIELNDVGRIESKIGCVEASGKPTMWLDFSKGFPEYHEHVVVHEFGHALGLEHEHQRSDFWKKIEPYMDTEKMKGDLPDGRYKDYAQTILGIGKSTQYDPESVMHYWFKREWLKEDFGNMTKVKQQRKLFAVSESERDALLGVHCRDLRRGCVRYPSEKDLKFLNELYGHSIEEESATSSDEESDSPKIYDFEECKKESLLKDKEARKKIDQLRTKYNNLRGRLCKHLLKEGILACIRETLASLCGEDPQYQSVYEELKNEENVDCFFKILESSLLYLDFNGLLDQLIHNHGSIELRRDAESYREELVSLLGRTTVKQAANPIHPWWPAQHSDVPKNFTEVKTLVLDNPENIRLIDIVGYRMRFTSEVRLSRLLFLILGLKELNSYIVSWLVPSTIVPVLQDAIKRIAPRFFQENKIGSVSIVTEQVLYDSEKVKERQLFLSMSEIAVPQSAPTTTSAAFVERRANTSQKHRDFVTEPMEKKAVTKLPGIGEILGKRLGDSGFMKAEAVLGKYLQMDKNEQNFKEWLKDSCGANDAQREACYQCLQEWCQAHI